jgi:hypothetical protein
MKRLSIPIAAVFMAQALFAAAPPSVAEARKFIEDAEARLLALSVDASRADWVKSTYSTDDTEALAAKDDERLINATAVGSGAAAVSFPARLCATKAAGKVRRGCGARGWPDSSAPVGQPMGAAVGQYLPAGGPGGRRSGLRSHRNQTGLL